MGRSLTFWLIGLSLVVGCATGTDNPDDKGGGSGSSSGSDDNSDGGLVLLDDSGHSPPGSPLDSGSNKSPVDPTPPGDSGGGSSSYDSYAPWDSSYGDDDGGSSYDSGGGATTVCKGYAPPTVTAGCTACKTPPCQANGCYGGYWCEMSKDSCHEYPPSGC